MFKLRSAGEGFLKDRGSRFIAYAYPVESLDEVQEHLQALRKQYYDARHHCYAYRLGQSGQESYSTDDGEPSHSAGTPILGTLRSAELTDALIVVIRYFGGTKLGVRGLIEAYRGAAEEALEGTDREEIIPQVHFRLDFAYEQTSAINKLLHPFDTEQLAATYTDTCSLTLALPLAPFAQLESQMIAAAIPFTILRRDEVQ
ncbi:MAG: YigZ family protein [Bacteroidota bacterium]